MLGHTQKINSCVWGPLNRHIYTCADDKTIRVWDPEVWFFPQRVVLEWCCSVICLFFSPLLPSSMSIDLRARLCHPGWSGSSVRGGP